MVQVRKSRADSKEKSKRKNSIKTSMKSFNSKEKALKKYKDAMWIGTFLSVFSTVEGSAHLVRIVSFDVVSRVMSVGGGLSTSPEENCTGFDKHFALKEGCWNSQGCWG
jgi:hypothetical protein